jgi:hypothetical protein
MKKINNKILAIGLVVLVGIFVLARVFRSPKLESNVRKELVSLDVSKVTEVRIASRDSSVQLVKENGKWSVVRDQNKFEADSAAVMRMLQTIQSIDATRMISRKKDKWAGFKVDSTGTNVSVYYGSDKEADFQVGSLGFNQNPGGNGQFGQGQGMSPYTYVRLADEDEVYIVDGFLGGMLPTGPGSWRKKPVPPPADTTRVN